MSFKSFLDITHKYQEAINNINESIKYHKILDLNKNIEINKLLISFISFLLANLIIIFFSYT